MNQILSQLIVQSMSFDIDSFLNGLNTALFEWGSIIVVIIGIVMVIVGVFNIAKGLMSGGRGQVNWVLNLILFFVGGAIAFTGGFDLVSDVAGGGADTLNSIANRGNKSTTTIIVDADAINDTITVGDYVVSFEG